MHKPRRQFTSHAAWHTIGDKRCYFRSRWESTFARWLENQKAMGLIQDWEYEPQTFWFEKIKRGVRSYKPDFRVTRCNGFQYWVEVKGYLDSKSKTKIKRFQKYYPDEILMVVDSKWFAKLGRTWPTCLLDNEKIQISESFYDESKEKK